jgi:uncharacterized membrane protein
VTRPERTFLKSRSRIATRSSGNWRSGGSDDGQVTVLVIGFVVVALAVVAVVVSATQVHLERTRLAALADLAALAAAERVSDEAYFASGAAGIGPSDDEVASTVDAYLADHPDAAARWTDLRVLEADSPDGRTVRVTLAAVVRPAWTAWVLAPFTDGIAIGASSSARAS